MALAKCKDILRCADENGFAAAAVNVIDYQSANWIVKAAEMEKMPVILMFYPGMCGFIPMDVIAGICNTLAKKAEVPVAVHLDHSDAFASVMSGIPSGFQSIMYDGSMRPFEENAGVTRRVVESAHVFGVDVEAELGHVGSGSNADDFLNTENYTSPEKAAEFVSLTGVDSLAVAIGNSHGHYVCEPHLDIQRLDEINRRVSVPLVLHGGSGIPAEQVAESIKHGICKVNIGTDLFTKYKSAVGAHLSGDGYVLDCLQGAGEEVTELIRERIRRLNPVGFKARV